MERGPERDMVEHGRWAGGNIRATAVLGLGSSGQRARRRREGAAKRERVWRPRNALCEEGRSYWICLAIGSHTRFACTLQVSNWNRCCGEYLVNSAGISTSPTDTPRLSRTAGAWRQCMSYVQHTLLCAREPENDVVNLGHSNGTPASLSLENQLHETIFYCLAMDTMVIDANSPTDRVIQKEIDMQRQPEPPDICTRHIDVVGELPLRVTVYLVCTTVIQLWLVQPPAYGFIFVA